MTIAAIALGSNLNDPVKNVSKAIEKLAELGKLVAKSRLFWTRPWGIEDQPDFCNAVALIDVELEPHALLTKLKSIEKDLGRTETIKWGPRVIDLDILTYGATNISSPDLIIPHPHMMERAFVLIPLVDVMPEYSTALADLPAADINAVQPVSP